jgi:Tfp pilus assembly protein PilF
MSGRIKEAIEEQRTIAQICLQSNNNQEAIAALHQVIGLAPEDTKAYFQLATVLSTVNEHHQAYRLYQRVIRMEPDNEKAKVMMEQTYKRAVEAGQIKAGQQ